MGSYHCCVKVRREEKLGWDLLTDSSVSLWSLYVLFVPYFHSSTTCLLGKSKVLNWLVNVSTHGCLSLCDGFVTGGGCASPPVKLSWD